MKTITFSYGADLDWTSGLAKELDGRIEENLIISSETISIGDRFFTNLQKGVAVYYHNTTALVDMKMIQKK